MLFYAFLYLFLFDVNLFYKGLNIHYVLFYFIYLLLIEKKISINIV